ncbi:MAG: hypothetical protein HEQ39_05355 [Rhizobacter sp.]
MFTINFKGTPFERNGENLLLGSIEGPGLSEDFWSPLNYWQAEQYRAQWKDGVARLLGGDSSALVVSMRDPKQANFINWWLLYPVENQVHLQNQMLLLEDLKQPFNEEDIYSFIRPYRAYSEDGEKLSEWKFPMTDISGVGV